MITIGLSYPVIAEDYSKVYIKGEPTYELIERGTVGGKTFSRYLINITFINTGTADSEELKVNFTDAEGFLMFQSFSVKAGEEKIVTFDWSTLLFKNQNFAFKYCPTNLDSPWYQYNSGTKAFTLVMVDDENGGSIPGFELFSIIFVLMLSVIYLKRKQRL